MTEDLAVQILGRYSRLKGARSSWEPYWQDISELLLPNYSTSFFLEGSVSSQGQKRDQKMFDSTANMALGRFAAAMESMLTPKGQTWHRLRANDRKLAKRKDIQLWFDDVNDILFDYRYATKANYASQQHEIYTSLGAFGTGAMYIDALTGMHGRGLRYRNVHIGQLYFAENHQGIIDTVIRKFKLTARQAVQKWGEKDLPEDIVSAARGNGKQQDEESEFIHCVMPRQEVEYGRADYKGMPWASYYIAVKGQKTISEGGYHVFPYTVSRYVTAPGETYGRSPAMDALTSIKVLNEEKKTMLKAGHRAVDPVLLAYDDGVVDSFSLKPGAMNYGGVSADGRPLVHALPTGSVNIGKELMDDERRAINAAFLVDLFQILVETPQMTATEVLERAREKGALLSPTMGRQETEAHGPQIERELDVLSSQNLLPPMPQALKEAGGAYAIEYDSPLSRAQKAEEASGLMRTVQWATEIASNSQNPEPLDWFDWDAAIPDLAYISAVPSKWIRSPDAVAQLRQGRSQQQQTEQLVKAGPAMASMVGAATKMKGP